MLIGPCHQSWSQVIGRRLISSFLFGCIVKPYPNLIIFLTLFYVYFILRATRAGQNLRWVGGPFFNSKIQYWFDRSVGQVGGVGQACWHAIPFAWQIPFKNMMFVSFLRYQTKTVLTASACYSSCTVPVASGMLTTGHSLIPSSLKNKVHQVKSSSSLAVNQLVA